MLKNYKELNVWQQLYQLCINTYKLTAKFPIDERYGLTSQIRRSVVSIPSNIAEGYGRKTTADYIRMLYIAYGSICELETQMLLAGDLEFIESGYFGVMKRDIEEIERMLKALIKSLENKHLTPWIPGRLRRRHRRVNLESFSVTRVRAVILRITQNQRTSRRYFFLFDATRTELPMDGDSPEINFPLALLESTLTISMRPTGNPGTKNCWPDWDSITRVLP